MQVKWWQQLVDYGKSLRWARVLLLITTTALLPAFMAVFVNLLTSAKADDSKWAWTALIAVIALQVALGVCVILGEWANPVESIIQLGRTKAQLARIRSELDRRSTTYDMFRRVIDALNLQTCNLVGNQPQSLGDGLTPIMQQVMSSIACTLGVRGNDFTIELYFELQAVAGSGMSGTALDEAYFFGPHVREDQRVNNEASPVHWGWPRGCPGQCHIRDDKERFFEDGKPRPSVYFSRLATVPVHYPCASQQAGLLVLTSKQEAPFAADVLQSLQFLSSLMTQFLAAHNRCVEEWNARHNAALSQHGTTPGTLPSLPQATTTPPPATGSMICPPCGYQDLNATISPKSGKDSRTIKLEYRDGAWRGGSITMTLSEVLIDGERYPVRWSSPLDFAVVHQDQVIQFTE